MPVFASVKNRALHRRLLSELSCSMCVCLPVGLINHASGHEGLRADSRYDGGANRSSTGSAAVPALELSSSADGQERRAELTGGELVASRFLRYPERVPLGGSG